jgi:8-oxo-dGTP diphosphatase
MSREYPDRPYVGVGVVVLRGDSVLLVRRSNPPKAGSWSLPGGGQELGETVFEAGRREVAEETDLNVDILGVVDVVDSITRDADGRIQFHYTLVDLCARSRTGEPRALTDVSEVTWAATDALDRFNLWSETVRVIRLACELRSQVGGP